MELRVLGAHNLESKGHRMESHLIDGVLALDAGSLTRALTFEEQKRVRAIILTHRHFDHVRDLPVMGLAVRGSDVTVDIYAIQDTCDYVSSKLLDGSLYPNPLIAANGAGPTFRLNVVEFHREFKVLDYTVMAVPVPHSVPAAGYRIASDDTTLFYTGDAGEGLSEAWEHVSPNVLLAEVTFGNEARALAGRAGHLTPELFGDALESFKRKRGYLPRVIVSHLNPPWEATIHRELDALGKKLGIEISVAHADMTVQL